MCGIAGGADFGGGDFLIDLLQHHALALLMLELWNRTFMTA
jgi:hypothetical protein